MIRPLALLTLAAVLAGASSGATLLAQQKPAIVIQDGLASYQVLQRNEEGTAAVSFKGMSTVAGTMEARLQKDGTTLRDWSEVGRAAEGTFSARIERIPTGGEYTLELRLRDGTGKTTATTAVEHLLVGDLWVLAGQSNMQGVGNLTNVEPPSPRVHSFDMADRWQVAEEPLHWLLEAVDSVHWRNRTDRQQREREARKQRETRTKGAGLGLAFANEMVRRTGVPVGLVPCAHGGTSMDQWSPALKDEGGRSLYGAMIRRITQVGGRVKGVLWYQGESDALSTPAGFATKFNAFIPTLRSDTDHPDLPFYHVQIGRFVQDVEPAGWNTVQEAQRRTADSIPHTAMVASVDLPLDDSIHISTAGLKRLGIRLAKIACRDLFGQHEVKPGPQLEKITQEGRVLRVTFRDVNGSLRPATHLGGFSIRTAGGTKLPIVFEAKIDPDRPSSVLLKLTGDVPEGAFLWYGHGLDPYCNLHDAEEMAAPVFGPVALGADGKK